MDANKIEAMTMLIARNGLRGNVYILGKSPNPAVEEKAEAWTVNPKNIDEIKIAITTASKSGNTLNISVGRNDVAPFIEAGFPSHAGKHLIGTTTFAIDLNNPEQLGKFANLLVENAHEAVAQGVAQFDALASWVALTKIEGDAKQFGIETRDLSFKTLARARNSQLPTTSRC